jgi:type I restriction enzyme S subunit
MAAQIPWVKSGELNDGVVRRSEETITQSGLQNSSAKIFPAGTVCVALYGATVGRVGILEDDAATNQAVCGIQPKKSIDHQYLFYFLQSQRPNFIRQSQGGAQPNISQEIVRSTSVPISPHPEQVRIVAEIEKQFSRLDAATAALKRVQANLKRYRAAVLKTACEGRLVPTEAELAREEGSEYALVGRPTHSPR